ncbi:SIMPL domain-containing protein [uncultured Winogradskyella sp.]|uniref:SIMPL domain-containing protein n=1 Tax=uncultured Winogradskyella sp. TaxID=395353 RepID=UPI002618C78A|nr:SIMPL domain-containing protein [uncultured Winogradskyella sp.]
MKHFIIVVLLCISTFGISQNATTERTITTYGSVVIESNELLYKTDVTLSLENNYYAENPCTTLEELKEKYFKEVKNRGVDITKFVQDDMAYSATGYRNDGTTLHFETKDKEEMLSVVQIKMAQVMPSYVQVKNIISKDEVKKLAKEAIEEARKNAELLAEVSGEKIDKIHSINSYDLDGNSYWRSPSSGPSYLRLTVIYALKD